MANTLVGPLASPLYADSGKMLNSDYLTQWQQMSPEQQANSWFKFTSDEGASPNGGEGWHMTVDKSKMPSQWQGLDPTYNPTTRMVEFNQKFLDSLPGTAFNQKGYGWDQSKTLYNPIMNLGGDSKNYDTNTWSGAEGRGGIKNKAGVYYDKNYGWITPQANTYSVDPKENGIFKAMNQYGMPAGLAIAGLFGMPAFATGLFGAAKGYGDTGNWKQALLGAAPGLIGAGLGAGGFGLPTDFMKYLNYAKTAYGIGDYIRRK